MIGDGAFGSGRAVARIFTALIAAGQIGGAVVADDALRQTASSVRIAVVAFGTEALSPVDRDSALGIDAANFVDARILTLAIDASL